MKINKLFLIFALFGVTLIFLGQSAAARVDTGWSEKQPFTCTGNRCYVENSDLNDGEITFVMQSVFHREDVPTEDKKADAVLKVSGNEEVGYNVLIELKDKSSQSSLQSMPLEFIIILAAGIIAAAVIWHRHTSNIYKSAKKKRRK